MDTASQPEATNAVTSLTPPGRGARAAVPRKPHYQRLTRAEEIKILSLAHTGITQTEIARIHGITQQRVSELVASNASTVDDALNVLQANARHAAEQWVESFPKAVKRGDHRPMKDALIAVGVVKPDPGATGITVVVCQPGDAPALITASSSLLLPDIGAEVIVQPIQPPTDDTSTS